MGQLDFTANYILENNRVWLEPLTKRHFLELEEISKDDSLWTYFIGESNGKDRFRQYIDDAIEKCEEGIEYSFAVFDKRKNKYAGSTRFFDYSKNLNIIRLGYTWYDKEFRGTGVNKNCKYLLFQFAFEQLAVERVGLGAHAENVISIQAMKSIGCKKEGTIRNLFPSIHNNGRADAELFSIIRKEWYDSIKNDLKENYELHRLHYHSCLPSWVLRIRLFIQRK